MRNTKQEKIRIIQTPEEVMGKTAEELNQLVTAYKEMLNGDLIDWEKKAIKVALELIKEEIEYKNNYDKRDMFRPLGRIPREKMTEEELESRMETLRSQTESLISRHLDASREEIDKFLSGLSDSKTSMEFIRAHLKEKTPKAPIMNNDKSSINNFFVSGSPENLFRQIKSAVNEFVELAREQKTREQRKIKKANAEKEMVAFMKTPDPFLDGEQPQ